MKTYFFVSDIHSFYTPLIKGLTKQGFSETNPDHILVVLGDVFDRGKETMEVYNFLSSLPDDRVVLIRGNHESLFLLLLNKSFPESYDFSNGTVRTFCQIAGIDEKYLQHNFWFKQAIIDGASVSEYEDKPYIYWDRIKTAVKKSDVYTWLTSSKWVNYFETNKYICVHSFIPLQVRMIYFPHFETIGYREDWRNATQTEWEDATWGCPWSQAQEGWNKTGKTIMCGHWHTSDFFNNLTRQHKDKYDCPIFKSKRYKLIGLDACTVASGKINVLKLEEDEL